MIKSIDLINWKTHRHSHMDFQKGVNVLIGIMGAGKSSVMDAISYALFGTFPILNQKRITTNNIIMNRPSLAEFSEVKLTFEIDGNIYLVTRKLNMNASSEARIEKNGAYLQTQPERVTEVIEQLLKLDYDTFSRAVYAHQNQLEYFLDLPKSERKRSIDQMLGLDNFSIAEENATSFINNTRSLISAEEQTIAKIDINALKLQISNLGEEHLTYSKNQSELYEKKVKIESEIKSLQQKLQKLKDENERKKSIDREIITIKAKVNSIEEELKKINISGLNATEIKDSLKEVENIERNEESNIIKLREIEKNLTKEITTLESDIRHLSEDVKKSEILKASVANKDLKSLENELKLLDETHNLKKADLISKRNEKKETEKWLVEIEKHTGSCPLCEQALDQKARSTIIEMRHALKDQLGAQIIAVEKEILLAEQRILKMRIDIEQIRKVVDRIKEYEGVEKKLIVLEEKKPQLIASNEEVLEKINKTESVLKTTRAKKEQLKSIIEKIERSNAYSEKLEEYKKLLLKKETEFKLILVDERAIYLNQEDITKNSTIFAEINSKINSNATYIKNIDAQLKEKNLEYKRIKDISSRIESRQNILNNMNRFKQALIETEASLRNNLVSAVNNIMYSLWPQLYPYSDYKGLRLYAKSDDYSLEANIIDGSNDTWVSIDSIASGGERSLSCLTMRIALSMVIVPNLKWIILDEPTHNIDSNGIEKIVNVFGNNLPKIVDQIFVITHDEAMRQIGGAAIYQLERNKALNGATEVSTI